MKVLGLITLQLLIIFTLSHEPEYLKLKANEKKPFTEEESESPTTPINLTKGGQCKGEIDCPRGCRCIYEQCDCKPNEAVEKANESSSFDFFGDKLQCAVDSECPNPRYCQCIRGNCYCKFLNDEKADETVDCKLLNCEGAAGNCYCSWMNELKVNSLKENVVNEGIGLKCPPFNCHLIEGICACFDLAVPVKLCSQKECLGDCGCWNETCFCSYLDLLKAS
jgi:hypothetical protein